MDGSIQRPSTWNRYTSVCEFWCHQGEAHANPLSPSFSRSFQGFLRRIHRWPVLLPPDPSQGFSVPAVQGPPSTTTSSIPRKGIEGPSLRFSAYTASPPLETPSTNPPDSSPNRYRSPSTSITQTISSHDILGLPVIPQDIGSAATPFSTTAASVTVSATHRARRASAAEKVLEQLRSRDLQRSGSVGGSLVSTPRTSWIHLQQKDELNKSSGNHVAPPQHAALQDLAKHPESRRQSLIAPIAPPSSPLLLKAVPLPHTGNTTTSIRPRPTWPIATPQQGSVNTRPFPPELLGLLDGEHHTDELAVRFEAGWPVLERWLVTAGGGRGEGDFGRVCIIYQ